MVTARRVARLWGWIGWWRPRSAWSARVCAAARRAAIEARYAQRGEKVPGFALGPGKGVISATRKLERARREAAERPQPEPAKTRDGGGTPPMANTTDPDSRSMKTANGWVQGYNAQAAVNEHQVVVAADVTQDNNDVEQAKPMMAATAANLAAVGAKLEAINAQREAASAEPISFSQDIEVMLFDAGYWSVDNATADGPDRLIATDKDWRRRKQLREQGTVTGDPPDGASPKEAMEHRLCTAEGAELYAKRAITVEPVFGQHKHNRGFRRFVRRGLDAAKAEWLLICATGNLLKVYQHRQAQAANS